MSAVTGSVVPDVRVTVSAVPSTEPAGTASVVASPASAPFATTAVNSTANGAPTGTSTRTLSVPTFSTVTVSGSTSPALGLLSRVSRFRFVRPENTPSGSEVEVRSLFCSWRPASAVRRENTPSGSEAKSLPCH